MTYLYNPLENDVISTGETNNAATLTIDVPAMPPAADAPNPAVLKLLSRHLKEHRPLWQALANS